MILVGTTARLKEPLLGNPQGYFGVCYLVDYSRSRPAYWFIFENGNHDGFYQDEVERILEISGHDCSVENYVYTDVQGLSNDFKNGVFDSALLKPAIAELCGIWKKRLAEGKTNLRYGEWLRKGMPVWGWKEMTDGEVQNLQT